MSSSPVSSLSSPQVGSASADPRNAFRTKTVGTRLSVAELEEVEAAARRAGQSLAEWLRENALREARQRPGDPAELLLAEVAATRYMLLNLFHATALAHAEGRHLLPDSVLKIRETADARKLAQARKMLQDFFAAEAPSVPGSGVGK
jgi:hypothetical protein